MAPFSLKCTNCGEYIYKGRKFNARKETTDERYLNIPIYRFYIRCTRCSSEITFKTDPKNMDYTCEKGAKRNFEPWREANKGQVNETEEETLDRLEREENEAEEQAERDKMMELEEKMQDSKREMAVADALDEIRTRNARIERGEKAGEELALLRARMEADEARAEAEAEDAERARQAFMTKTGERVKRLVEEETDGSNSPATSLAEMPPPSFTRVKKAKKPFNAGLGIKKKSSLV